MLVSLLDAREQTEVVDREGHTALLSAVRSATDVSGKTSLGIAKDLGHQQAASLLESEGRTENRGVPQLVS